MPHLHPINVARIQLVSGYKLLVRNTCIRLDVSGVNAAIMLLRFGIFCSTHYDAYVVGQGLICTGTVVKAVPVFISKGNAVPTLLSCEK